MKLDSLVIVSDTHCGSHYGIMPPDVRLYGGNVIQPNKVQRWLYDCWQYDYQVMKRWTAGRNCGLIINGDAIEGNHHRTTEIVSVDEGDHLTIAKKLFKPFRKLFKKAWIVEGTECHTKNLESSLGEKLDCERYSATSHAWPELPIEVNGCFGIVRHHITTTSRPHLEASGIGIQMNMEVLEAARSAKRVPKWCAYAHRHKFGYVNDGDTLAIVTNPWQALTRHGRKVVGSARYVKPGMVFLDFADMQDGLPVVKRTKHEPYHQETIQA